MPHLLTGTYYGNSKGSWKLYNGVDNFTVSCIMPLFRCKFSKVRLSPHQWRAILVFVGVGTIATGYRSPCIRIYKKIYFFMAKKLFVGNLAYNTTDKELTDAFAQAGTVESATVITDRMSGRSKGFGFVEMSTDEEATAAVEMLNGKDLGGRAITVNEARPRE